MRVLGRAVETDLGELGAIAWQHRRLLGGLALGAGLAALLISFLLTPRYHAVASVLPRKGFLREQQIVFARGSLSEAVAVRPTTASNSQNLATAASYAVRAALVDSLGLVKFFGHGELAARDPEAARQRAADDLRRATHFELSIYRDVLFIHVMTRDPALCARIANLYVTMIERTNLELYRTQALAVQRYLEDELLRLRTEMFALADSIGDYYRAHGLIEVEGERERLFALLGELEIQRSALAVALGREALDRREGDPQLARLRELLGIYDELIVELGPQGPTGGRPAPSGVRDPRGVLEAQDLEQRLERLQERESGLRIELAAAVMGAAREEAALPVMDRAFPASEPYWPRRWLMTLAAAVLAPGVAYLALVYRRALKALAAGGELR